MREPPEAPSTHPDSLHEVDEFVPEAATPDDWGRLHRFRRRMHQEWRSDEGLTPDDVEETSLRRQSPTNWERHWLALQGGEVVGRVHAEGSRPTSPEYPTNRHLLWAGGYVLRGHRGRGIGRAFASRLLQAMEDCGATVLNASAEDDPGHAFLRSLGAMPRMVDRESRLSLTEVDWAMAARWVQEGETAAAGTRLVFYPTPIPEEVIDRYCTALTDLLNTMPWEDMDHGLIAVTPEQVRDSEARFDASGSRLHTAVAWAPDGAIAGMTDVLLHPYEPGWVRQLFTGVDPGARGRGLGKWLKAAMLLHLRRAHPDASVVITENAHSNAAMLAINEALGFRLHREVTTYQVDRDSLAGAL